MHQMDVSGESFEDDTAGKPRQVLKSNKEDPQNSSCLWRFQAIGKLFPVGVYHCTDLYHMIDRLLLGAAAY